MCWCVLAYEAILIYTWTIHQQQYRRWCCCHGGSSPTSTIGETSIRWVPTDQQDFVHGCCGRLHVSYHKLFIVNWWICYYSSSTRYIQAYGSAEAARNQIINNWNIVSAIYEDFFNIFLGLIDIRLQEACGGLGFNRACSDTYTITNRLSDFSKWRGTQPLDAGLWHLMSSCKYDHNIV